VNETFTGKSCEECTFSHCYRLFPHCGAEGQIKTPLCHNISNRSLEEATSLVFFSLLLFLLLVTALRKRVAFVNSFWELGTARKLESLLKQ
jgi:hypothetical protein